MHITLLVRSVLRPCFFIVWFPGVVFLAILSSYCMATCIFTCMISTCGVLTMVLDIKDKSYCYRQRPIILLLYLKFFCTKQKATSQSGNQEHWARHKKAFRHVRRWLERQNTEDSVTAFQGDKNSIKCLGVGISAPACMLCGSQPRRANYEDSPE